MRDSINSGNCTSIIIPRAQPAKYPLPLKPDQPESMLVEVFVRHGDCVPREIRTFNFGKKCKQYYPLWQKKVLRPRQVIYQQ